MNLSNRIWKDEQQFKDEMEVALTVSIGEVLMLALCLAVCEGLRVRWLASTVLLSRCADSCRCALPMDITGGIATSIMMALDNRIATTERTKIIKQITKLPKFRKYETVKNRTLWIWENIDNSEEFIKNYAAGSKALSKGYDVFMLPNPRGGKSPDFILSKGHKYYFYECKTINGMASVGARLNDAASQCDRIFLDVADNTESRMLANELISFYERNPQIKDIMMFKGKKELHISRNDVNKRNFVNYFIKFWAN